jgi:hypothetical protein
MFGRRQGTGFRFRADLGEKADHASKRAAFHGNTRLTTTKVTYSVPPQLGSVVPLS